MLEKHIKLDFNNSDAVYTSFLVSSLQSGIYSSMKELWVSDVSLENRNSLGHHKTIVDWAVEENKYSCLAVWNGFENDPSQNFGETYYRDSAPFIDFQIAKGNFRINYRWI
jgi:hypothetical protein